jgi:hypothetical protein
MTPMELPPPRPREQRKADVLRKLRDDVDIWVASADERGRAYLVPLSFYWDGSAIVVATPRLSRTGRNLLRAGRTRVALGPTRDVVIVEAVVEEIPIDRAPEVGDAHARATGFDARAEPEDYVYLRFVPREIQAWREANELPDRQLMRRGAWLTD